MTSMFFRRRVLHYTLLFLFLAILFTPGCAGITIPSGEEYIVLSNAEVTPEVVSDDGSIIKVDYSKTTTFRNRDKLLLGYFISTKGLEEKPGAIIGEGVICYLLLSDLDQMNADLANERDAIRFPITNSFEPTSRHRRAKYKLYAITGRMHDPEFTTSMKHRKYAGNTTISIFLSVEDKRRVSNILTVPVTFR